MHSESTHGLITRGFSASACGVVMSTLGLWDYDCKQQKQAMHVCSVPAGRAVKPSLWRIPGFVSQTNQIQSVKCYHGGLLKPSTKPARSLYNQRHPFPHYSSKLCQSLRENHLGRTCECTANQSVTDMQITSASMTQAWLKTKVEICPLRRENCQFQIININKMNANPSFITSHVWILWHMVCDSPLCAETGIQMRAHTIKKCVSDKADIFLVNDSLRVFFGVCVKLTDFNKDSHFLPQSLFRWWLLRRSISWLMRLICNRLVKWLSINRPSRERLSLSEIQIGRGSPFCEGLHKSMVQQVQIHVPCHWEFIIRTSSCKKIQ